MKLIVGTAKAQWVTEAPCVLVTQQVGAAHAVDCFNQRKHKKTTAFGAQMRLSPQKL